MKESRCKIGLIFSYNENWIGGTYYLLNLIACLSKLSDDIKPIIIIFTSRNDYHYVKENTNYPYLEFQELNENPNSKILIFLNRLSQKLFRKKWFIRRYNSRIDAIFPFVKNNYLNNVPKNRIIYWIPDFQEKYYPNLYTKDHLAKEIKVNSDIVYNSKKLVLSSESALQDLKVFYPLYNTTPYKVNFAVEIPKIKDLDINKIRNKFGLRTCYFFAPNQFWKHKNHIVAIKAVEILVSKGMNCLIAFSGKESDPRFPGYTEELKEYVYKNNLGNNIKFLGFLERQEQLKLMENAIAIVQPSLFEGWSTVIEEAMALNKCVIASNLKVNIEQLGDKGFYFDPLDPMSLANVLEYVFQLKPQIEYEYESKQIQFAKDFLNCVKD